MIIPEKNKKIIAVASTAGIVILCLILFFTTRKSAYENGLKGRWYAAKLTECDKEIAINSAAINLEFKSNGTYIFNSTLNIHEEGVFKVKGKIITLQDKIRTKAPLRNLLITNLEKDSLLLGMNSKGLDQTLLLIRDFRKLKSETDSVSVSALNK